MEIFSVVGYGIEWGELWSMKGKFWLKNCKLIIFFKYLGITFDFFVSFIKLYIKIYEFFVKKCKI